jgi:hypothetical protein
MNSEFQNPFAGYGQMVYAERFIGRQGIREDIERLIITPQYPGNLAIIGIHRIGKSSFVNKTIIERRDELINKRILPIWISLASYQNSSDFFLALVTQCVSEMKKVKWLSDEIQNLNNLVLNAQDPWNEITDFFQGVNEAEYGTLFILDEFDDARRLFKGDTAFMRLRQLASNKANFGLSLVLTSRREIREIELQAESGSPFHNIFNNPYRLGMFSNEDLETYFSRFSDIKISISDEAKKRMLFYCGNHPYLLEMLGNEIVESYHRSKKIDVDQAADAIIRSIHEYYQSVIDLLRNVRTFDKLLQILFSDSKPDVDDGLEGYGLIKPDPNKEGAYVAYSEHFEKYLRDNLNALQKHSVNQASDISNQKDKSADIRNETETVSQEVIEETKAIWDKTEIALRQVITTTMADHQDGWIEILQEKFPSMIKSAQTLQAKGENDPGVDAPQNPISFTQTADLFQIILDDQLWENYFQCIFKGDQDYWKPHQEFLAMRRNYISHSNSQSLQPEQFKRFQAHCEEILRVLSNSHEVKVSVSLEPSQHTESNRPGPDAINEDENQDDQKGLNQSGDEVEVYPGLVKQIEKSRLSYCFIEPITPEGDETLIRVHKNNFPTDEAFDSLTVDDQVEFTMENNSPKVVKTKSKG